MKAFAYRKYLLFVLAVILAFNYVDRMALGLVLQNIKVDLRLSDTQLGLLSGIAFALFYSTLGVPIGRWADRGNRITIISVTAALWSVMVMLSGAARSFVRLSGNPRWCGRRRGRVPSSCIFADCRLFQSCGTTARGCSVSDGRILQPSNRLRLPRLAE